MSESAMTKIAVLGGGSFGTVIANISATQGVPTTLWMRSEKQLQDIRKQLSQIS
jgi:glycerol-3-phosphate dehydrogenase (NAD(P)+)